MGNDIHEGRIRAVYEVFDLRKRVDDLENAVKELKEELANHLYGVNNESICNTVKHMKEWLLKEGQMDDGIINVECIDEKDVEGKKGCDGKTCNGCCAHWDRETIMEFGKQVEAFGKFEMSEEDEKALHEDAIAANPYIDEI
jgi:hypothetical protein